MNMKKACSSSHVGGPESASPQFQRWTLFCCDEKELQDVKNEVLDANIVSDISNSGAILKSPTVHTFVNPATLSTALQRYNSAPSSFSQKLTTLKKADDFPQVSSPSDSNSNRTSSNMSPFFVFSSDRQLMSTTEQMDAEKISSSTNLHECDQYMYTPSSLGRQTPAFSGAMLAGKPATNLQDRQREVIVPRNFDHHHTSQFPSAKHPCWVVPDDADIADQREAECSIRSRSGVPGSLTRHMSLVLPGDEIQTRQELENLSSVNVVPGCTTTQRAKRGCATHPRSIAERVRRMRISERIKKLQEVVPNLNKQTSTADMLDEAVEYIRSLQEQVQELTNNVVELRGQQHS